MDEWNVLEELRNVCAHYPVEPGNTISHTTAYECAERGWIVRDASARWIPTAAGIERAVRAGAERLKA